MQTAERIRDANVRYHDLAAEHYDSKWGIAYNEVGQAQVTGKLRKALGHEPTRYGRALEIGAGTGYFTLNLLRAGVVGEAVATDISPGMLRRLSARPARSGSPWRRPPAKRPNCPSRTTPSTSASATPSFTTSPTCRRRSGSSAACSARAAWWLSAGASTTATARLVAKPGASAVAPLW